MMFRSKYANMPAAKTAVEANMALAQMWTKLESTELRNLVPHSILKEWDRMLCHKETGDIDHTRDLLKLAVRTSDDRISVRRLITLLESARRAVYNSTNPSGTEGVNGAHWYAQAVLRG